MPALDVNPESLLNPLKATLALVIFLFTPPASTTAKKSPSVSATEVANSSRSNVNVRLAVRSPPPARPTPAVKVSVLAAAPKLVLAAAAVIAPVPPWEIVMGKVILDYVALTISVASQYRIALSP